MPRTAKFVAAIAAGLIAGSLTATAAFAIATPVDSGVLTNALLPLKGSSASGTVTIQVDWRARKVCYALDQKGLTGALSGALMKGSATIATFKPARNGALDGCADISQEVGQVIIASPTDYMVSINNGALTATLSPWNNFQ
jgi:hypothetical protein